MPPADSASRAGVTPKASGDPSSRTFGNKNITSAMKTLLSIILVLISSPSLRADDTVNFGPGTLKFLFDFYAITQQTAIVCAQPIPEYPVKLTFSAKRGHETEAIADFLANHYGIMFRPIDKGITVASTNGTVPKDADSSVTYPLLPSVFIATGQRFEYTLTLGGGARLTNIISSSNSQ